MTNYCCLNPFPSVRIPKRTGGYKVKNEGLTLAICVIDTAIGFELSLYRTVNIYARILLKGPLCNKTSVFIWNTCESNVTASCAICKASVIDGYTFWHQKSSCVLVPRLFSGWGGGARGRGGGAPFQHVIPVKCQGSFINFVTVDGAHPSDRMVSTPLIFITLTFTDQWSTLALRIRSFVCMINISYWFDFGAFFRSKWFDYTNLHKEHDR